MQKEGQLNKYIYVQIISKLQQIWWQNNNMDIIYVRWQ